MPDFRELWRRADRGPAVEWPEWQLCIAPELIDVPCPYTEEEMTHPAVLGRITADEKASDRTRWGYWRLDPEMPDDVRARMNAELDAELAASRAEWERENEAEIAAYRQPGDTRQDTLERMHQAKRVKIDAALAERARRLATRKGK